MKTKTISYTYDPDARALTAFEEGKAIGGFRGHVAEQRFAKLLDTDVEIKITRMNTNASHGQKVRRLRAIWIKAGIDNYRDGILEQYNVTSTADLTDTQLDELIRSYSHECNPPASDAIRHLRSELLTICNKLGIYSDNGDWCHVNDFFMDKRIAGKLMFQLSEQELKEVKRKLHSILTKRTLNQVENDRKQNLN